MSKTLTRIGNDLGLVIDPQLLETLGIKGDTPLDIVAEGGALVVRPAVPDKKARIVAAADRIMKVHAETLRKLAE
jgi:antitoxin component of MazEF toxin-antitoxin module